jgi:hypothetical protein
MKDQEAWRNFDDCAGGREVSLNLILRDSDQSNLLFSVFSANSRDRRERARD